MASYCVTIKRFYGSFRAVGENYYEVLRVRENSSRAEIREAFMQLSKEYHPDAVGLSNKFDSDKTATFVKIAEAYSILSRPSRKKEYDDILFMRTVAHRQARSGSYGFVHDFHCFGRNRPVQRPVPFKYPEVQKVSYKPLKPLKPLLPQEIKSSEQSKCCVIYRPMPRILFQMTNVCASVMSFSGICGAVYGVVNARCGFNHVKMHAQLSRYMLNQKRVKAMEELIVVARRHIVLTNNISKSETAKDKTTIHKRLMNVFEKYFREN